MKSGSKKNLIVQTMTSLNQPKMILLTHFNLPCLCISPHTHHASCALNSFFSFSLSSLSLSLSLSSSVIFKLEQMIRIIWGSLKSNCALAPSQMNGVRITGRGKTYITLYLSWHSARKNQSFSSNFCKHLLSFLLFTYNPIPFLSSYSLIPS